MDQGHMPGPWVTHPTEVDEEYFGTFIPVRDATRHLIALVWNDDDLESEHANARLIAAAPDLLEACRIVLRRCDGSGTITYMDASELRLKIVAAIAKAEGRADG